MKLMSYAINLIFPASCRNCNSTEFNCTDTPYFCNHCWDGIAWFDGNCCPKCGIPYTPHPETAGHTSAGQYSEGHICGDCRRKSFYFDKAIHAGPYGGVLAEAIRLFKYKKKVKLGKMLTRHAIISTRIKEMLSRARSARTVIIPVPLHMKRLREREFNQSAIISSVIGKEFGIPLAANALVRHRYTKPQVELDGSQRKENVIGAFSVRDESLIEGKEIILVDDVYTSGSTVNECSRVLKEYGGDKVYVITISRMAG